MVSQGEGSTRTNTLAVSKGKDNFLVPYLYEGFAGHSDGEEYACNMGDLGLIPGLKRSSSSVPNLVFLTFLPTHLIFKI